MAVVKKMDTFTSVVPPAERVPRGEMVEPEAWTPPPPTLHIEVPVAALESAEVGAEVEFKARGTLVSKENRKTRRGQRICYGLEVREIAI